jgi:sterol 3beta-glucosyltransferase
MRAVLTSFGSTGDVVPFVALAEELRRHGHEPILALSPNFAAQIERRGLTFVPVGPDLQDATRHLIKQGIEYSGTNTMAEEVFSSDLARSLFAPFIAGLAQMFHDLCAVCGGADVLISSAELPLGRTIHEVTQIPFVSVHPSYFGVSSKGSPLEQLEQEVAQHLNRFRAQWQLPPLAAPLTRDGNSPQLALLAISRFILKPSPAWPPHYQVTGFFFLDEDDWQPDPALAAFLAAGPPPILIDLGSTIHEDPEELTSLLLRAVRRANCRAIIQHGWSGLALGRALPPHVHALGFVSHNWLLPRTACVVHHGSPGTAAAVFRAGVPAICVPHFGDQFFFTGFAQAFGGVGAVIPYQELTAERLSAAITTTLTTPRYRQAAARLGEQIRSERGVQLARALIEQLLASGAGHRAEPMQSLSKELGL